jgi:hypothetical protein
VTSDLATLKSRWLASSVASHLPCTSVLRGVEAQAPVASHSVQRGSLGAASEKDS